MNNKVLISAAAVIAAGGALAAYQLFAENRLQQEQLTKFEEYVAQLQAELESFAEQQISYETQLNSLRRDQSNKQSQIDALETELEMAEAQIDPDVIQLEQQIRERVIVELQQTNSQEISNADLLKQLNTLDQEEIGQLMAMQSLYGGFLRELDVDDERMGEIANGLINMVAEQNQRRMEVIEEIRNDPDRVNEIRQEMLAMASPEAQLEALSYILTEEELAIYEAFQQQQLADGVVQAQTFSIRGTRQALGRGGFIRSGGDVVVQDGQGDAPAIQIIRAEPAPQ